MKNINQFANKRVIFGIIAFAIVFGIVSAMPARARAFQPAQLIDPFCFFACEDDKPNKVIVNVTQQTPSPSVSISASPSSVNYNGSSAITWNSSNATSCNASGESSGWSGSKATSGTFFTGALTNTITFHINCSNSASSASDSVTVNVSAQVQNPTVSISANPLSVDYNGASTITWNSNNATSCDANGGTNGWSGSKSTSGTFYTGPLTNTITYNINCSNSSGSANGAVTINVTQQTPSPSVSISASPSSVNYNGSSAITWNSSNATSCSASGESSGWSGSKATSGTFFTGALTNTITFYINCSNSASSVSDSVTVNVGNNNNDNISVNITADDTRIDFEDSTRIRWSSNNADYCIPSGGTNDWDNENIGTSGTFNTRSLTSDKTFRITCYNNNNSANDSVTVRVDDDNNDDNNDNEPDVTTRNATNISTSSATLNGRVDGNDSSARAWFEYGTNTNFGYSTSRNSYGSRSTNYSKNISGLYANTTYYFRAVAENSQDIVYGSILSFHTTGDFVAVSNQPTVVIYADQTNLAFNTATNIRWNTTNATSCFASGGSIGWAGARSIGLGYFYTGALTGTRTYTITCSNSAGSYTDSVTVNVRGQVITTTVSPAPRPTPTSLVLITSSIDRNQQITPMLDNTRPRPGDEINYTVGYQNIGTGAITNLVLQIYLPQEVNYMFSYGGNPNIFGNTLIFNLGTLRANGQGSVTVRARIRDNIPAGTNLNFPAALSYINPSGQSQSVNANASAQVWSEPAPLLSTDIDKNASLEASAFGAGFLPVNLLGWLLLVILVLLLILIAKYLFDSDQLFPFSKKTVTTLDRPSGEKTTTTTIE